MEATIARLKAMALWLMRHEIWPVALAVGAGMAWPPALVGALAVILFFWPVRWLATGRLTRRTPGDLPVLLLLLMAGVSWWATAFLEVTTPQILRLLAGIGLYYAVVNWTGSTARLRTLLAGTVLVGAGLALATPVVVLWSSAEKLPLFPAGIYDRFPLLVSDSANPNVMAGFLALLLPLPLALALYPASLGRRLSYGLSAVLMTGALVLTQSRGALLGVAAGLIVLALTRWPRSWPVGVVLAALGGLAIWTYRPAPLLEALAGSQTLGSLAGRAETWSRALYMIQDFPFTGIGMGSFTQVLDLLYPLFLLPPGKVLHAHNLFLQIAVDLGLPGLVAWLAIWMTGLAGAWGLSQARRGWTAGVGAGLLASQVTLGVHGLLDSVTWGLVRPAPIVWGLWGLTMAAWQVKKSAGE